MFEDESDESGFWNNVPTSRFDRLNAKRQKAKHSRAAHHPSAPVGTRSHDDTQSIPVVAASVGRVQQATQHVDPLLRRAGTLAVVITLLVPVALALRSGDSPARDTALQPQASALDTTVLPAATADQLEVPALAPAPAPVDVTAATIDINALPVAVPAHTEAPTTTAAKAPKKATSTTTVTTVAVAHAPAATQQATVERATTKRPACTSKYTVRAGDAWVLIAKRVGVSTKDLLAANGATTRTAIYPGRQICLPANATVAAAPATTAKPAAKPVSKSATPAPKATTTTTVKETPPARVYSKAEVAQIIRDVWPDELEDEAIRIATRESNLVPSVKNYCCYGLFQIYYNVHKGWLAQMGVSSGSQLWDPRTNALAAYVLYQRSNSFAPWN